MERIKKKYDMKRNIKMMIQKGTTKKMIWRELQKRWCGRNYKKYNMEEITKKII